MTHHTHDTGRRHFLHALGALGALGLGTLATPASRAASIERAWQSSYAPWSAPGFEGSIQATDLPMKGRAPAALRGRFYRNGPARFGRGSSQLNHWFDGDGMVQRFEINGPRVSHLGRMLDTAKSREEASQGRFLYNGFGSRVPNALPAGRPDNVNVSNINLLPMQGGRTLYALWEAGSALQIDPDDLHSIGLKHWSADTLGAPFSAHPRIAADGTVWNFGYQTGSGRLLIYQIGADGRLMRQQVLQVPQADMVHDFAITEHHLVFLLQPLLARATDSPSANVLDMLQWDAKAPMRACLIRKSDLQPRFIELPNSGVFHLGNAWEHGNTVRLGYVHHDDLSVTLRQFDVSAGNVMTEPVHTTWIELELEPASGRSQVHRTPVRNVEFPRFDPRRTGQASRLTVLLQRGRALDNESVLGFDRVLVLDGDRVRQFDYGKGWFAEEHIYVPHPTDRRERAGWVLGTAFHWPSETTMLSVFAAADIGDGPLAQWRLPYGLPLGLHGQFVPA